METPFRDAGMTLTWLAAASCSFGFRLQLRNPPVTITKRLRDRLSIVALRMC